MRPAQGLTLTLTSLSRPFPCPPLCLLTADHFPWLGKCSSLSGFLGSSVCVLMPVFCASALASGGNPSSSLKARERGGCTDGSLALQASSSIASAHSCARLSFLPGARASGRCESRPEPCCVSSRPFLSELATRGGRACGPVTAWAEGLALEEVRVVTEAGGGVTWGQCRGEEQG